MKNKSPNIWLFFISLTLNIILLILLCYKMRVTLKDKLSTYQIVMFGDSFTESCDWAESLDRDDIKKSGYSGFIVPQMIDVINCAVTDFKPATCFIQGGSNDIKCGIPVSTIFANYTYIINTLREAKIEPVIQSTLNFNRENDSIDNSNIDSLNHLLSNLAKENKLHFIDLNKLLSLNGRLRAEYTIDGRHINQQAYKIWVGEIKKVIDTNGF